MSNGKVRDKFWIFTSKAHDDDIYFAKCEERKYNWSRITPAEGAFMLGTPNAMMVISDGQPVSYSSEAYGTMESFCRLDKVLWSVRGSGGFHIGNEEEFICHLAEKYPNMAGTYIDDLFALDDGSKEAHFKAELLDIKERLSKACRPMEIWATVYAGQLKQYSPDFYDPIDVVTMWNMDTSRIERLEEDFAVYEEFLPNKKKALGLYLFDYHACKPVSVEHMKKQCETGLKWLKEGRIDAMIFLTNCTMGMGFESEKWLRNWIDEVGDLPL